MPFLDTSIWSTPISVIVVMFLAGLFIFRGDISLLFRADRDQRMLMRSFSSGEQGFFAGEYAEALRSLERAVQYGERLLKREIFSQLYIDALMYLAQIKVLNTLDELDYRLKAASKKIGDAISLLDKAIDTYCRARGPEQFPGKDIWLEKAMAIRATLEHLQDEESWKCLTRQSLKVMLGQVNFSFYNLLIARLDVPSA